MEKEVTLKESLKKLAQSFLEESKNQEILVISHFDTDGITSASIMIQTLKKLDKRFTVKIIKSLEENFIQTVPKNKIIFFLDLASASLNHIKEANLKKVFIIDHHELTQEIPENIEIVNPWLNNKEKISTAGLVYLFCKEINSEAKSLAKLAVLGMIGDLMEKEIDHIDNGLRENPDIQRKQGLLIYPSTRPLNRTLEYSSNPYIPGVTGNPTGVIELLREAGIEPNKGKYKSLIELAEDEMQKLVTSIMLRNPKTNKEIIGDIFLIKFFNRLEDARELSAMVNACSRLGETGIALKLCMEVQNAKQEAEEIHARYKQHIISGLSFSSQAEKIQGKGFVIINAQDNIKDTIVGTIASILSNSPNYEEGTIIVTMAYYEDKIKVSSRVCGRNSSGTGRNVREILELVIKEVGGEVGGHEFAAGCIVHREKEKQFLETLKKNLEIELVKI